MPGGLARRELSGDTRQHLAAFGRQCGTGALEVAVQPIEIRAVVRRHQVPIEQGHPVDGGVVLRGDEERLGRDVDADTAQSGADLRPVQDRHRGAGVGGPTLPAARAAVQRRLVGIVLGGAGVRAQHDEPAEALGEAHHGQRHLCEEHLLVMRHGVEVDACRHHRCQRVAQPPPDAGADRRAERLGRRQRRGRPPGRLGQDERRGERLLGGVERRLGAGHPGDTGDPTLGGAGRLGQRALGDVVIGRDQHRAQVRRGPAHHVGVADGDGEESGEAEGLVTAECLEMAAQSLRAGVDAAHQLGVDRAAVSFAPHRQGLEDAVAVVRLEGVLPQHFPRGHGKGGQHPGGGGQLGLVCGVQADRIE